MEEEKIHYGYSSEEDPWAMEYGSDDEFGFDQPEPQLFRQASSAILSEETIKKRQSKYIMDLQDALAIDKDQAIALLLRSKWNYELAMDKFTASLDEEVLEVAAKPSEETAEMLCETCYCEYPRSEMLAMSCRHFFCRECYSMFLSERMRSHGVNAVYTNCPQQGCKLYVSRDIFTQLLSEEDMRKYDTYYVNSFVAKNRKVKWCPAPGCTFAAQDPNETLDVFCTCGHQWCFHCEKDAHYPMLCTQLHEWLDRLRDGLSDENELWKKLNTKPCPKCKTSIEKNQGCMHMTCSQCRYEFCWLCMGDYQKHTSETGKGLCNSYEDVAKLNRQAKDMGTLKKIDQRVQKFAHYATRYKEHLKSVKFAQEKKKQLANQVQYILEQCEGKHAPSEFDFLTEVADMCTRARRAIAITYGIRFFLKGGAKKRFFDFIQGELEWSLEKLTSLAERDISGYFEYTHEGTLHLGEKFFKFKAEGIGLNKAVQEHFQRVIEQIETNFPDV